MKKILKNKLFLIIIFLLVLLVLWGLMVVRVNINTEDTLYKYYEPGEEFEYKGLLVKIYDYERLSEDELEEKYGVTDTDLGYNKEECHKFAYVLWLEFKKESENDTGIIDVLENNQLVSTAISTVEELIKLNEDGIIDTEIIQEDMAPGDSKKVGLIYTFVMGEWGLSDYYVEHFDEYPLYFQLPDYEGSRFIRKIRVN